MPRYRTLAKPQSHLEGMLDAGAYRNHFWLRALGFGERVGGSGALLQASADAAIAKLAHGLLRGRAARRLFVTGTRFAARIGLSWFVRALLVNHKQSGRRRLDVESVNR
jgi:hypothetical protein